MKRANGVFIGLIFIIIGLLYACSAFDLFDFTIFFPGWWTLFIIVPCIYALSNKKEDKTGPVIGLVIGLCFLINAQDFDIHIDLFPLILAVLCILIGWKLIVPQKKKEHKQQEYHFTYNSTNTGSTANHYDAGNTTANSSTTDSYFNRTSSAGSGTYTNGNGYINVSNILGGKDIRVDNECFTGADITVIMGAVDLNLKNAIISEDVYINVTTIMGGVDIYVPANVRVVTDGCAVAMGGVEVNDSYINFHSADSPRVIITGVCIMGGIEIK